MVATRPPVFNLGRSRLLRYPYGSRCPREPPIRTVRIEAPSSSAATQLVQDLVPFAQTDIVPLGGERWEIRVEESSEEELDAVLHAVARWAADCRLSEAHVLVDDAPIDVPRH
jgi:hypothetical protein